MKVVGVKLNENGKVYYFDAADVNVHENSTVIVQTEKGLQYGIVVKFIPESDISYDIEYKKIVRLTTKSDYKKHMCNLKDADRAIVKCNELIEQYLNKISQLEEQLANKAFILVILLVSIKWISGNNIKDLPSNKKSMFSQNEKSFAKIRINSNKSICSFQENNIIIVVTFEGKYYQALLDTKHGGDCQINGEIDLKI